MKNNFPSQVVLSDFFFFVTVLPCLSGQVGSTFSKIWPDKQKNRIIQFVCLHHKKRNKENNYENVQKKHHDSALLGKRTDRNVAQFTRSFTLNYLL